MPLFKLKRYSWCLKQGPISLKLHMVIDGLLLIWRSWVIVMVPPTGKMKQTTCDKIFCSSWNFWILCGLHFMQLLFIVNVLCSLFTCLILFIHIVRAMLEWAWELRISTCSLPLQNLPNTFNISHLPVHSVQKKKNV